MRSGYRHPRYAQALSGFGTPRALERCGGWVLEKPVPGRDDRDATGCYPLFACESWPALADDLDALATDLVSLSLVTDPFGAFDAALLERAFRDVVVPFKEHFVVDLGLDRETVVSSHHRRNARRALAALDVERLVDPAAHLGEWSTLYDVLVRRHAIRGVAAFSVASFREQLRVPGIVAFRARAGSDTVGMTLWYLQDGVAYYHLGAYSERGYAMRASFALFWEALGALAVEAAWASLGAGAGVAHDPDDGLARFKAGWATGSRTAWLCGRVFQRDRYADIVQAAGGPSTRYFPAYRQGGLQ